MDAEDADIEATSKRIANLSVCDERSPLKGIPLDSPRIRPVHKKDGTTKTKASPAQAKVASEVKEAQVQFNKLVKKGKQLAQEGKVQQALELNKQALAIHYHDKLARRIAKMEEYLKNYEDREEENEEDEEDAGGMIQLGSNSGFYLHKDLSSKLYHHQKEGVQWMWGLHKQKKGGILGDDMGLGKTIQVIGFLSGLFDMDKVRTVMIILPVSVMTNWEKEFNKWAPGIAVHAFHGTSKRERQRTLDRVQRRGGVMLTTYGMVLTSYEQLSHRDSREFIWDYVILDEGHKIKNPSKTTKAIYNVQAKHRLILTGTPIQNNLKELWILFDYIHQGSLLGTLRTFKMEFENPITRARERDSTAGEKRLGLEMAQSLKKIIDPFFLRRTKAQVKEDEKNHDVADGPRKSIKMPTMTFKNDFVVWLFLSDTQLKIYSDFLQLASVKELLMSSKSPLVALTVLKKICDHPRLLSLRACHQLGLHGQDMDPDELDNPSNQESAVTKIDSIDDSVLVGEAGKMGVLITLVDRLREEEHRALIFSQSRKMLDIIQKVLRNRGHKVMRMDGTVKGGERDDLVQKFQKNPKYSVFLLTTQVGGVGLTLTAADRVIIYDPSWNPATDAQAVDRAFRIGQTKNVVIYRLITCGTVEEKIYRRQVFKDSITRQTTGNTKDPFRYFTKQELRELFQLGEPRFSNTQQQLEKMHGLHRRRDHELDDHIAFLHSLDIFGISDHDLMFSQESPAHEMEEEEEPQGNKPGAVVQNQEYIMHRVQKAKEIIARESSVPGTMEERMKSSSQVNNPQASMKDGVPVFQPNPMDNPRPALNRPGAGGAANIFRPMPTDTARQMLNRPPGANGGKPPQMYPPKPVKPQAHNSRSASSGSSTSDPIDLTCDDRDSSAISGETNFSRMSSVSSSVGDDSSAKISQSDDDDNDENLPQIERRKQRTPPGTKPAQRVSPQQQQEPVMRDKHHPQATSKLLAQRPQEQREKSATTVPEEGNHQQEEANRNAPSLKQPTSSSKTSSSAAAAAACSPEPSKKQEKSKVNTTPKAAQRVVEEEMIISPNAYTPLMTMRKKRRRVSGASPMQDLSDKFSSSVLVEDSPGMAQDNADDDAQGSATPADSLCPDTPKDITSFLADDDLEAIQESLVEDSSTEDSESQGADSSNNDDVIANSDVEEENSEEVRSDPDEQGKALGSDVGAEDEDSSDERGKALGPNVEEEDDESSDEVKPVKTKRRRSVCRRVAVIESSEDEQDDEENKENLYPSFSANASHVHDESDHDRGDGEDEGEVTDEDAVSSDKENQDREAEEVQSEEEEIEEEESNEDDGDENKEHAEEDSEGDVHDESAAQRMSVYDDSMREGDEDEEELEEEEGEEEEEEEVDVELFHQLLAEGKQLYRQKEYPGALERCQAALAIVYNRDLEAMVEKIQNKIQQGL